MSKLAFMTLLSNENTNLSPHFGKAKWVMIRDTDTGTAHFVQNTSLNGQAVVAILAANGCSDVVFTEIGPGALAHLQAANIRGWFAPANVPVAEIAEMFARGTLKPASAPSEGHGHHGCGHPAGAHA